MARFRLVKPGRTKGPDMTLTAEIKCINKIPREDENDSITHVGGFVISQWKLTLQNAIRKIERVNGPFM